VRQQRGGACPKCGMALEPLDIGAALTFGVGALVGPEPRSAYALVNALADKTGMLTEGKPKLVIVETVAGASESEVLRLAASLKKASEHPLAAAIVGGAEENGLQLARDQFFQSYTGKGIFGVVEGKRVALGNLKLFDEMKIDASALRDRAEQLPAAGQTVMFVAIEKQLVGLLGVADPFKSSIAEAIEQLHAGGIRIVMLSGNSKAMADAVARKLGIDEVHAEVLPNQKREVIKKLQSAGRIFAMAGDGINDAPALAQAQVGIAMGHSRRAPRRRNSLSVLWNSA